MVRISDGSPEHDAHVCIEKGHLDCLRHCFTPAAVHIRSLCKNGLFILKVWNVFLVTIYYTYHGPNSQ